MMSKVFVTGASGLLGSHILIEFSQSADIVYALFRSENSKQLTEKVFEFYGKSSFYQKVVWVKGDLSDFNLLLQITKNVNLVIHSAALVSFEKGDRRELYKANVEGTRKLLRAVGNSTVEKFVFISSVATIRNKNVEGQFVEDGVVMGGRSWSDYACSKTEAEEMVIAARKKGLNTVIVNPGVILGPGNINSSSTAIFKTVKEGLKFYTSGINGVVDVRDVVMSIQLLLEKEKTESRYVCVAENIAFKKLFTIIANEFGVSPPSLKASPLLLKIACTIELIISSVLNRKPRITKENTSAAFTKMEFSSSQLVNDIGIDFRSVEEAVKNTVGFLKSHPRNTN